MDSTLNLRVPLKTGEHVRTDFSRPPKFKKKVNEKKSVFKTRAEFFVESAVRRR